MFALHAAGNDCCLVSSCAPIPCCPAPTCLPQFVKLASNIKLTMAHALVNSLAGSEQRLPRWQVLQLLCQCWPPHCNKHIYEWTFENSGVCRVQFWSKHIKLCSSLHCYQCLECILPCLSVIQGYAWEHYHIMSVLRCAQLHLSRTGVMSSPVQQAAVCKYWPSMTCHHFTTWIPSKGGCVCLENRLTTVVDLH
jgi:hypothetical protein